MTTHDHDRDLAQAFGSQAPKFEVAPVQSDPVALERLTRAVDLPAGSLILDAGCGPGLVSAALLAAGYRVVGVDLSKEMIARAQARCASFGKRARFLQTSVYDQGIDALGPFEGSLSRYVLHHVEDPLRFVERLIALLRPGGVLIVNDHLTDPDPSVAAHHAAIEVARDRTHTRNLTGGELVDLFARAGLVDVQYFEERFTLDFDEWFDRGTPSDSKEAVRSLLLSGPVIRSFRPRRVAHGPLRIDCFRAIVRAMKI
jgi:SAM-dependent methyltransferase